MNDPLISESINRDKLKGRLMQLSDPPFPDSMYAVAKLFGEDLGKLYALQTSLEVVTLRIGWILHATLDDPTSLKGTSSEQYMRAMYLSHRDAAGYFRGAIEASIRSENGIRYMMAYACSMNEDRVWDLTETIQNLSYTPVDSSRPFFE
eukprot:TRINITY_DN8077_c0_g1_i1.p1 TRINITY_DN8077_c0_g1~~TRINITY_DN8077_c0_g1_i1.p1  ORF type:complete len:149 (+),score=31.21 TRINITY_DN8077_c0_g1_i1:420-866(+)